MKSPRGAVAIIAIVVWVLSAPLAMASSHCMGMGAMCEGPCGASPCAVAVQPEVAAPIPVTPAPVPASDALVTTSLPLFDPPPRTLLRFS
jgi:hypothetical protein